MFLGLKASDERFGIVGIVAGSYRRCMASLSVSARLESA